MTRCRALTRQGTQCKREAIPGSEYCPLHVPRQPREAPPEAAQSTEGTTMPPTVIIKTRKVRVRYTGNSSYWIRGYRFSTTERELEVPYDLAEYLIEQVPELFEPAE